MSNNMSNMQFRANTLLDATKMQLTFATNIVVDSERSAAAVIGLSRLLAWASMAGQYQRYLLLVFSPAASSGIVTSGTKSGFLVHTSMYRSVQSTYWYVMLKPVHTSMYWYVLSMYRYYDLYDCHEVWHCFSFLTPPRTCPVHTVSFPVVKSKNIVSSEWFWQFKYILVSTQYIPGTYWYVFVERHVLF